jgi:hypothetical protein
MNGEEKAEYDQKQKVKNSEKTARHDSMRKDELALIGSILGEKGDVSSSGKLRMNDSVSTFLPTEAYYKMYRVPAIPPKLESGRIEKNKVDRSLKRKPEEGCRKYCNSTAKAWSSQRYHT